MKQETETHKPTEVLRKILVSKPMTPERLRSYKGFEDVTDQEARNIIETLKTYSKILLKHSWNLQTTKNRII
ncbi:MAG: hypothetical protein J5I47_04750 [Vicingus serpentipes]|nr:hypothetical protein [Vicingus serpentipes]